MRSNKVLTTTPNTKLPEKRYLSHITCYKYNQKSIMLKNAPKKKNISSLGNIYISNYK